MSMHRKPLTPLEYEGLTKHGLPIGTASQLSDCFRLGIRWAKQQEITLPVPATQPDLVAQAKTRSSAFGGAADALLIYANWIDRQANEVRNLVLARYLGGISVDMRQRAIFLRTKSLINYDRIITQDHRGVREHNKNKE